jgi:hypothetical protein
MTFGRLLVFRVSRVVQVCDVAKRAVKLFPVVAYGPQLGKARSLRGRCPDIQTSVQGGGKKKSYRHHVEKTSGAPGAMQGYHPPP